MPVKKFRSVEEIPPQRLYPPGSEELSRAIASTWAAASWMAPHHFPPGVYRHRSDEELNAQTDRWTRENIAALARRQVSPAGNSPRSSRP